MPRQPGKKGPPIEPGGQVNFKADRELWERIQRVCRVLGLDTANLGRLLFNKYLHHFEKDADEVEAQKHRGRPPSPEDASEGE